MESTPRRARRLIPTGLERPAGEQRGSRVAAACAVLALLAHLLLAPLTGVVAAALAMTGRAARWRLWWLTVPAGAGLCWALAIGPGAAGAGFAAGPAHVLGYLGRGDLLARLSRPAEAFAGVGGWLPRQLPLALAAGAAEAALFGWLGRLRSGAAAARPPRPGLVAAVRTRLAADVIGGGAVVTRAGCALGVDPGTGATVDLRWDEIAGGALVAGAAGHEVTITGLQVAHAALRRRKPLIVIDVSDDGAIARALSAACTATGTPLRHQAAGADLYPVVIERSAALVRAAGPESAGAACAGVAALAADLRRVGVDGDGLVWITGGERLSADAVAALVTDGRPAGLAVLIGTTSAASVPELAEPVAAVLVHRITDAALAAWLTDPGGATGIASDPSAFDPAAVRSAPGRPLVTSDLGANPTAAGSSPFPSDPSAVRSEIGVSAFPPGATAPGPGRSWFPSIGPRRLLSLGPGELALAVRAPAGRVVVPVRRVPARLPSATAPRPSGAWRRLRYDPA